MDPFERVVAAVVKITKTGGQGTLIPGGFILTAAHCIKWSGTGTMAIGDHFIESIETSDGKTLHVTPVAVDPVSDIALLGELDEDPFHEQCEAYRRFCGVTQPAEISDADYEPRMPFPVRVRSHRGHWLDGRATKVHRTANLLFVETIKQIQNGTSGGPIVSLDGQIVAVVSQAAERVSKGPQPMPRLCLPVWAITAIRTAVWTFPGGNPSWVDPAEFKTLTTQHLENLCAPKIEKTKTKRKSKRKAKQ